MRRIDIPWNIEPDMPRAEDLRLLRPVTKLDSFDATGQQFHEDGLFSVSTFGRVGEERRRIQFAYLDLKTTILHPVLFRSITGLKQLYREVMSGTAYAVVDTTTKDLVRSDAIHGKTGFAFFLSCMDSLKWPETDSPAREEVLRMLKKYKGQETIRYFYVMPAGLRDLEMGPDNRPQEHEINKLYRKLLAVSQTVQESAVKQNIESLNAVRWMMQLTAYQIYAMVEEMIDGRRKLIQNRWTARRVFNGTRNVISAMDVSVSRLGAPGNIRITDTGLGLYQTLKGLGPVPIHQLQTGFLSKVFQGVNQPAMLTNRKTLKVEPVTLPSVLIDAWMTTEGLNKVLTAFQHESIRHREMIIADHYVGLIYKGPDNTFRVFQDIDELPPERQRKDVSPITFAELLYTAIYVQAKHHPNTLTRYPVQGTGSCYPANTFLVTTTEYEIRRQLNEHWHPMTDEFVAYRFPLRGSAFIDTALPHPTRLAGLDGDHDGDTVSNNYLMMDEPIAEIQHFLTTKKAYVGPNGKFLASFDISPTKLVFMNMTGEPKPRPWSKK